MSNQTFNYQNLWKILHFYTCEYLTSINCHLHAFIKPSVKSINLLNPKNVSHFYCFASLTYISLPYQSRSCPLLFFHCRSRWSAGSVSRSRHPLWYWRETDSHLRVWRAAEPSLARSISPVWEYYKSEIGRESRYITTGRQGRRVVAQVAPRYVCACCHDTHNKNILACYAGTRWRKNKNLRREITNTGNEVDK